MIAENPDQTSAQAVAGGLARGKSAWLAHRKGGRSVRASLGDR
jgi:hypothetical protein